MRKWILGIYHQILDWWYFKKFRGKNIQDVFSKIHEGNLWRSSQSVSGTGSELTQTQYLAVELPALVKRYQVSSILDIPCGDYNWMHGVDLGQVTYLGADIVPELISENQKKYGEKLFRLIDLTKDPLPQCDLVICRDCLVHFSYRDIEQALRNLVNSPINLIWCTTFPSRQNRDIVTGAWRPINLQAPPFSFPPPLELFNEKCNESSGSYKDKSMGLWYLSDLRRHLNFADTTF